MTNYRKGADFEREFGVLYIQNYYVVRSAGSHSLFDLVLIPKDESGFDNVIVCQLKRHKKGTYPPKPSQDFIKARLGGDIVKWWVTREDHRTAQIQVV